MEEETIDDVRDNVDMILLQDAITEQLKTLTPREELVLRYRFWGDLTLKETGNRLGISPERTRQIESKGVRKLRHPSRLKEIEKYTLDDPQRTFELRRLERIKEQKASIKRQNEIWEDHMVKMNVALSMGYQRIWITNLDAPGMFPDIATTPQETIISIPKKEPSQKCPSIVTLNFKADGTPYLDAKYHNSTYHASVERDRDPDTYDRWLAQRLKEHKRAQ